jgi:hypothetical protein
MEGKERSIGHGKKTAPQPKRSYTRKAMGVCDGEDLANTTMLGLGQPLKRAGPQEAF